MVIVKLDIKVSSPAEELGRYAAWEVRLPAFAGEMGVRCSHTSLVGALSAGIVWVLNEETTKKEQGFYVPGGFFEINNDELVLLVDSWEEAFKIDYGRAEQARDRALNRLAQSPADASIDISRALASLKRAEARLSLRDNLSPSELRELQHAPATPQKVAVNM